MTILMALAVYVLFIDTPENKVFSGPDNYFTENSGRLLLPK